MESFANLDLKGKRVLLRADLNVPANNAVIEDFARINRLKPTIELLKSKGAKIILTSHFGRPDGKSSPEFSMKFMAPVLEKIYTTPVHFCSEISADTVKLSKELADKEIMLLENLRFYPGEETNDPEFAQQLAQYADIYINDAFACCHRAHASIVAITKYLPSYAGLLLFEEVHNLRMMLAYDTHPMMAIIGGKKVSTKFKVLAFMDKTCDYLAICGAMANTMLAAKGFDMQGSFYEPELVEEAKNFLATARSKIILPVDAVVATKVGEEFVDPKVCQIADVPSNGCILDVGPETSGLVNTLLVGCKSVLWNGPFGMFEDERFSKASRSVADRIAQLTEHGAIKSIAGGGDTVAALTQFELTDKLAYISTAGGAFLEWLESGTLPGIDALNSSQA